MNYNWEESIPSTQSINKQAIDWYDGFISFIYLKHFRKQQ